MKNMNVKSLYYAGHYEITKDWLVGPKTVLCSLTIVKFPIVSLDPPISSQVMA